ncbi:hypothetical protein Tco_1452981 [Tanacetum coccineum]
MNTPITFPSGPFNFNSDGASGFLRRAVGPNRLGGTRSSIRKRGSLSKNDDEVYGSKGIIPIQHYLGTYQNERTQGSVVHHSRYDNVPYPKENRYSSYPYNFCVRMSTIGEEPSRTRRESQRGRTRQTERAYRRRNTHPPCFPEQKLTIGTQFSKECRLQLINLLKNNMDVFTWQPSDMTGVPKRIIKHTLNVNISVPPMAQKRRVLGIEKS